MITYRPRQFTRRDWEDTAASLCRLTLMQSWAYGEAKAATGPWTVERGTFERDGRVVGVVQALLRRLPLGLGGLLWINRGPLAAPSVDPGALLEAALPHWRRRGLYVRVAPLDGAAPPSFRPTGTPGWASAILDLSPAPDLLRAGLDQKWRNALVKAEKSGLDVVEGRNEAEFAAYLAAYEAFLAERGFATTVTPDLLAAIQAALPPEGRMTAIIARQAGKVAAGALVVRCGETAEYLSGVLTETGRRVNAGQLALWRAVLSARDAGASRFDLGGMDELRTPKGIFRFKAGLNAIPYRLPEEIEARTVNPLAALVRWKVRRSLGEAT